MKKILHTMNPSVKLVTTSIILLTIPLVKNPWMPLLLTFSIVIFQLFFSNTSWKWWGLLMIPVSLSAFGYFWTSLVLGVRTEGVVLWQWQQWSITDIQLAVSSMLAFRMFAFAAVSFLFFFTTKPVPLIMSLMQNLRFPPKLAYSVMIGYQFVPLVKQEWEQIERTRAMRGVPPATTFIAKIKRLFSTFIPLLAAGIRKAEETAYTMEARGFTGKRPNEYYAPIPIRFKDIVLGCSLLIIYLCTIYLSTFFPYASL